MTNHSTDEDLVLHLYGEKTGHGVADHLAACTECADKVEQMRRLLKAVGDAPVPERGEQYGAQVWHRLKARLDVEETPVARPSFGLRGWALAAAAAAIAAVAFLIGRGTMPPVSPSGTATATLSLEAQERILRDAVARHFERSRRVLTEASNASGEEPTSFAPIRTGAEGLVADNRLFRQAAQRSGDRAVAQTLEELERALIEIANGPAQPTPEQIEALQRRLEAQGVLFKIRVLAPQMRQAVPPTPPPASNL
ncbi:MAG TPA: hypothetical protein VIB08_00245 [Thermoanaerobaculia bacterium]|jgi:hypothetical protein